jgi:hypothetical protein
MTFAQAFASSTLILAAFLAAGCGDAAPPPEQASIGAGTGVKPPPGAACNDGETQSCKYKIELHGSVVWCTPGVMTCSGGKLGECQPLAKASEASADPAPTIFIATCDPSQKPRWSKLTWRTDPTAASSIALTVQALPEPGTADSPRPSAPAPIVDVHAGGDPAACESADCGRDLAAALGDAANGARLRVSVHLDGPNHGAGPAVVEVSATFDCISP